jgi:hypothetical protein
VPESRLKNLQIKPAKSLNSGKLRGHDSPGIQLKYWIERFYPQNIADKGLKWLNSIFKKQALIWIDDDASCR